MLSDNPNTKKLKSPKKRSLSEFKHRYSDSQKLEAVKLWMVTGNLAVTAATLGIPEVTVKSWRYTDWWETIVQDIRSENKITLSNRLKNIASKAMDVTLDRLENGEWFYDQKTGELRRKPVLLKDAHKVASDLLQRQLELDKANNVQKETSESTEQKLNKLAEAFELFAKKTKKIEVIDVEFTNGQEMREREKGEVNALPDMQEMSTDTRDFMLSEQMALSESEILSSDNMQELRERNNPSTPES